MELIAKVASETTIEEERTIREASASLNLAVRSERISSGNMVFIALDQHGREMRISPELVRLAARDQLNAVLAAFAVGATEIKWRDGTTLVLSIEAETHEGQ